jgi:hypothetical protein
MEELTMRIDPDATHKEDAAYWAAALVRAIQNRNKRNAQTARANLRRLGYALTELPPSQRAGRAATRLTRQVVPQ